MHLLTYTTATETRDQGKKVTLIFCHTTETNTVHHKHQYLLTQLGFLTDTFNKWVQ